jgi:hypothetical protein
MKTHVDFAHLWLVEKRKLILIEKSMAKGFEANHIQQSKKKKVEPFGLTITTFLAQQIFTNMVMNHNKGF